MTGPTALLAMSEPYTSAIVLVALGTLALVSVLFSCVGCSVRARPPVTSTPARYLSPWVGLPGGRHTLGLARHWHFVSVLFWVVNGAIYVTLLFATGHWRRIVPTSWRILPDAWAIVVHYATFHLPPEPNGFCEYNALQQLSYFAVIFILAPLSILTGPAMSPALVNRFSWYRRLPGNRQIGRSIHFLLLCAYVAFVIAHVTMVFVTGFARNMNHIVIGTDDLLRFGMYIGLSGLAILFLLNVMANWATWLFPRAIQRVGDALVNPVLRLLTTNCRWIPVVASPIGAGPQLPFAYAPRAPDRMSSGAIDGVATGLKMHW